MSTPRRRRHAITSMVAALVAALMSTILAPIASAAVQDTTFTGTVPIAPGTNTATHAITVGEPGTISATLNWTNASANLNLILKRPDASEAARSFTGSRPETITFEATVAGTYKLNVIAAAGSNSAYTLSVSHPGTPPPPPRPEDTNPTSTFSAAVDSGVSTEKTDVHTVTVGAAGTISATLDWTTATADLSLILKRVEGTLQTQVAASSTARRPELITFEAPAAGTYRFNVIAKSGSSAYTLKAAYPAAATPPPATGETARYDTSFGFSGPAKLYAYGMDWDSTDNSILVGDYWNYQVKRFTSDGKTPGTANGIGGKVVSVTKPADTLGGTTAPYDVEADLYDKDAGGRATWWSADQGSYRIVQFSHDGTWLQTIGRGGGGSDAEHPGRNYPNGCGGGKMTIPTHIYVDPTNGQLYVSDPNCRAIYMFSHTGDYLGEFNWTGWKTDSGLFTPIPRGLAAGPDGKIYVVEFNSRSVVVFNKDGSYVRKFPRKADMNDPRGLDIDPRNGDVVVAAGYFNEIHKFRANGEFIKKWGTVDGTPTGRKFDAIRFPAVDGQGNIYVGDTWGTRNADGSYTGYGVYKFTADGAPLPWATSAGAPPDGGYNQQNGIAIDKLGKLFVVDTFEQRVQKFNTASSCMSATSCPAWELQFGSREPAGTQSKGFGYPRALTYGADNDLIYVGDNNNAVLAWTPGGQFVKRFGSQGKAVGQFSGGVQGIHVTGGNIYTTDVGNCRLSIWNEAASLVNTNGAGSLVTHMGTCGTGANQMSSPRGIAVGDASGNANTVYVAETGTSRISRWDVTAKTSTQLRPSCGGVGLRRRRSEAAVGHHVEPQPHLAVHR
jgi:tripartite motif-containing protein 71